MGAPMAQPEVLNAQLVAPQLMVGGDLSVDDALAARQIGELAEWGVTHIIDCRFEWSDEELIARRLPRISYLHHGMDDAGQVVPPEWFDTVAGFALAAMADPHALVLAHCHMGINRGPSAGFAILLARGWDPVEALDAIRAARPVAIIDYARDALRWHHLRRGSGAGLANDLRRLQIWRRDHQVDLEEILRAIRTAEGSA